MQILEPSTALFSNMLQVLAFVPFIILALILNKLKNKDSRLKTTFQLVLLLMLIINIGLAVFASLQYFKHTPISYSSEKIEGYFGTVELESIQNFRMLKSATPQSFLNPGDTPVAFSLFIKTPTDDIFIQENAYPDLKNLYGHLKKNINKPK